MTDRGDISAMPFAKIAPVVAAGILAGNGLALPLYVVAVALAVCIVAAVGWHRNDAASIYVALSLFFFSMGLTYLNLSVDVMPKGGRFAMVMHISDTPSVSGKWSKATAVVDRFRPILAADKSAGFEADATHTVRVSDKAAENASGKTEWLLSREKVIVRFDTMFNMSVGDRIIATGYVTAIVGEGSGDYVGLMRRRGYSAAAWVSAREEVAILPGKAKTPAFYAARMQSAAMRRLSMLDMTPDAMHVAMAMSIGARGETAQAIRGNYSLAGASHLLAVSGLHVGIVAMLIYLLLYFLPLFRYGHIVRSIVAIAVIWLYAMLTGLSPSVVRAAAMFSGVQLALASSRTGNGLNILLATATVMLFINPNYLYDISFQLSFTAVAGIFLLYKPIYAKVRTRFKAVNAIWAVFIVGAAATLATMPIVSHYFGRIPVIGVLMNPLVMVTANITVLMSMVWIIFPFGFLNGFFSSVIGFSSGLQNDIVEFCASRSWASVDIRLSAWQVVLVYLLAILLWHAARRRLRMHDGGAPATDSRA